MQESKLAALRERSRIRREQEAAGAIFPGRLRGGRTPPAPDDHCRHLGPPTGETVGCGTCPSSAGKTAAVHLCPIRERCAPSLRRHHEVTGCLGCGDFSPRGAYPGPVVRNLLYHLWPVRGNGVWQRNVARLRPRLGVFNGKRIVSVVTDARTDDADTVRRAFDGLDVELIFAANRPKLREVATWHEAWARVLTDDPSTITFCAHAKGVRDGNPQAATHVWTDVMWAACVDHHALAEDQLQRFPITGCFKKVGRFFKESKANWHYSGTFFWVRNQAAPGSVVGLVEPFWAGTEAWPGVAFRPAQGGVLFFAQPGQYDLYNRAFWDRKVGPAWEKWQRDHARYRRVSP